MRNIRIISLLFGIFLKANFIDSARILGIFHFPSLSHQFVYRSFYKELSLRGHEVVVAISAAPFNNAQLTNLTEIVVEYPPSARVLSKNLLNLGYTTFFEYVYSVGFKIAPIFLQDKRIQSLCVNETFDLVITEAYFPSSYAFGEKCKSPTIGIVSTDGLLSTHMSQGNPVHPALYGDFALNHVEPPTILQKVKYTYYMIWFNFFYQNYLTKESDYLIEKYIGKDFSKTRDLEKKVSLLLVNRNALLTPSRPLNPSTIPLDYLHIASAHQLPKDLQTILDNAKQGAIYFSLGSNIKSSDLPSGTVSARKWFPQQDVLAHPNVRGFVTQGGLQSTEEAIIYGTPMVGIPFFADQEMNVKKGHKLGMTVHLDKNAITKDALRKAIMEIMTNLSYQERIQELQKIAKDQPMTGLERAVWWTEYVIRHKGAPHLRSPAADISLFDYLLIDVILVVSTGVILISFILYKVTKILFRVLTPKLRRKIKKI